MADLSQFGQFFAEAALRASQTEEAAADDFAIEFIDSQTFVDTDYQQEWLVRNILVKDQPAIIGGPRKSLKTSILVDLAVSLAGGVPFLQRFPIEFKWRVGVISGESGERTLQETFLRVCRSKAVCDPALLKVFWFFRMPHLSDAEHLEMLYSEIQDHELEAIIFDPLYLGLLAGNTDAQASNLYHIGPLLARLCETCLDAGATPILAHHTRKQLNDPYHAPELEDLAFAGVQEFARQWLLIGRREKYEPGTGQHRLWLNVGGSAGHSGSWAVDIDEGQLRANFTGRRWNVQVRSATAEREADRERRDDQREEQRQERDELGRQRMLAALRQYPNGETLNVLREAAGMGGAAARRALNQLVDACDVDEVDVMKPAGQSGTRSYPGYRLSIWDQLSERDEDDEQ